MKKYRIESDNCEPATIESDGIVARRTFGEEGKWRVSLSVKGDDFIYEWNHGLNKGKVRIPDHIAFDLPELLAVLNHASKNKIMSPTRIYSEEPIADIYHTKK